MKRIAIFGVHLGYWSVYFLFSAFFVLILRGPNPTVDTIEDWRNLYYGLNLSSSLLGFYLFYYFLFNQIKKNKNILILVLQTVGFNLVIGFISSFILVLLVLNKQNLLFNQIFDILKHVFIFPTLLSLIHGILGLFMRAFFDWFNLRKEKEQLTKQNHLIEMELVKAQLNPHFLFNSLNNIDVLIYKDQDQASSYLNKLSDIMRYMLFDAKTELISFETEYHYIEKYIALHQLRASNSDYVLLTNEIENQNGNVASLVFMPFIENAFKYSSSYKDGNAIQIQFQQKENQLYFSCKNRITKDNEVFSTSNGLGNELLKKRLDLIYKEHYTLNLQEDNGYFCVALTIPYEAN